MTKMKKLKRTFSDEFKSEAVAMVLEKRRSQAEVARNLGLGSLLINKWCREAKN